MKNEWKRYWQTHQKLTYSYTSIGSTMMLLQLGWKPTTLILVTLFAFSNTNAKCEQICTIKKTHSSISVLE